MEREILRWYGRLATRTVRKPRSPQWAPLLPKGVFVPDLPVFKRSKQNLRDVVINDGLHVHGIVVANRLGRISEPLDVHFEKNLEKYLTGNLRHIDIERITRTAEYVTEYAMKGLETTDFLHGSSAGATKDVGGIAGPKPMCLDEPQNSSSEHFRNPF